MGTWVKTHNLFIAISLVKLNHSHRKYSRKKFYRRIFLKCNHMDLCMANRPLITYVSCMNMPDTPTMFQLFVIGVPPPLWFTFYLSETFYRRPTIKIRRWVPRQRKPVLFCSQTTYYDAVSQIHRHTASYSSLPSPRRHLLCPQRTRLASLLLSLVTPTLSYFVDLVEVEVLRQGQTEKRRKEGCRTGR